MGFVNKVMLLGNTTRDPNLRQLPSGTAVCDFGLATNRVYKTTNGEERQETVFIDCTAFGKVGETIAQYCPKGRPLFVEGRLHYETWEDQTGNRRSKLTVIVENFQFVGSREGTAPQTQAELPLAAPSRGSDNTDRTPERANARGREPFKKEHAPSRENTPRIEAGATSRNKASALNAPGKKRANLSADDIERMADEAETRQTHTATKAAADLPF